MITIVPHPDAGIQLFRNMLARLLSNSSNLQIKESPGYWPKRKVPLNNSDLRAYASPSWVLDGEWPRIAALNEPITPNFLQRKYQLHFILAGYYRNSKIFFPHREALLQEWDTYEQREVPKTHSVVVLASLQKSSSTGKDRLNLRPTWSELYGIIPDIVERDVTIVSQQLIAPAARDAAGYCGGTQFLFVPQTDVINLALQAKVLVVSAAPIYWWAGFLSKATTIIQLHFGQGRKVCRNCELGRFGPPELKYPLDHAKSVTLPTRTEGMD